ncbi:TPA: hypothetical protein DIV45_02535 [Patescibacteria group bacterium]|uniref:Uncharacterized protein n=1 Tax=candidate division Kazan bacterium GW2011_GWA1_44_22 TaxID=1620410 RepID=A0A0G1I2Y1_UNCK3|nr:MAG: hypothetical protein VE96_C0002G0002 [candidate division Kazan bacterium GW2011_GWA1_44_22]HCR42214.1 hypothetical protein [Patescibacteria group bacterium]
MGGVPLVKHLWGIWVASVIAAIAFWIIIWEFDPYTSHWVIFMLLFAGFLIFWGGVLTTLLYIYYLKRGWVDFSGMFSSALKLGIIGSGALTVLFFLQTIHILAWWNGLIVVVLAVILSLYFRN